MAHTTGRNYRSTAAHPNPTATARNKGQQGAAKRAAPKAPVRAPVTRRPGGPILGINPNPRDPGMYYGKGGTVAAKPKRRK